MNNNENQLTGKWTLGFWNFRRRPEDVLGDRLPNDGGAAISRLAVNELQQTLAL